MQVCSVPAGISGSRGEHAASNVAKDTGQEREPVLMLPDVMAQLNKKSCAWRHGAVSRVKLRQKYLNSNPGHNGQCARRHAVGAIRPDAASAWVPDARVN